MTLRLKSPLLLHRAKILSKFISVQLILQALGLVSGVLLVRTLEPNQYAYFTIANSMQSTMNLLTDMGIGSGLLSIGGKVWRDHYRFGQLINTAMYIRRYLSIFAMIVVTPILVWLLISNGASMIETTIIVVIVLLEFNFSITINILHDVFRLKSQIGRVQYSSSIYATSRLALLGIASLVHLSAAIAIIASFISTGFQRIYVNAWANESIEINAPVNQTDKKEFIKLIKGQALYFTFFIIQGQLTIWLISLFGSTQKIAEIGALGRLGVLLSIVASVVNQLIAPSFARCQSIHQMRRYYIQTITTLLLISFAIIGFAVYYPEILLWILGSKYGHLKNEVALILLSATLNSLYATMWSFNVAKGWIGDSWMIVPGTIVVQCINLIYLDISSSRGVIIFGITSIIPTICVNIYMSYKGFKAI